MSDTKPKGEVGRIDPRTLSDDDLHQLAARRGHRRLIADREFMGLLPEVRRRRLWTRDTGSMKEYVSRHGVPREAYETVIRLEERVAGPCPRVWELFLTGEVGYSKLRRVVSHLTPETEDSWVEVLRTMSKGAIESMLKERAHARAVENGEPVPGPGPREEDGEGPDPEESEEEDLPSPNKGEDRSKSVGLPSRTKITHLSRLREARLDCIIRYLSRRYRRSVSATEALSRAIDTLAAILSGQEPAQAKRVPRVRYQEILVTNEDSGETFVPGTGGPVPVIPEDRATFLGEPKKRYGSPGVLRGEPVHQPPLRYSDLKFAAFASAARSSGERPPRSVERFLGFRSGQLCEARWCTNPATATAHLTPRSVKRNHHPDNLARLCDRCHELQHLGWVRAPLLPARRWSLRSMLEGPRRDPVDEKVQRFRRSARRRKRIRDLSVEKREEEKN